jgi:uncharacterized membrane protein (UPF0127 family)
MVNKIGELKNHFEQLAAKQGYICEADYHAACVGVTDIKVLAPLNSWLVLGKFKFRRGVGQQYQQELLERVKHPNVRDVKDTKDHTHKNTDKKQDAKKEPEEHAASVTINKIVEELKNKDFEDEFLPPWKKREAADVSEAGFQQWVAWLLEYASNNVPPEIAEGWTNYINKIDNFAVLDRAWKQLQSGDYTLPDEDGGGEDTVQTLELGELDLDQDPNAEPLELDIKKSHVAFVDPVEEHLARVALAEYTSEVKKKVKFNNDVVFTVDVAKTPAQKAAGLEVFNELPENRGLLFPFDKPDHATFHMGRVKFPIDILFFMQDDLGFRVAKIVHSANPGDLDLWSHPRTDCVLEIPGGSCEQHDIKIDSYCKISDRVEV